MVKPLIPNFPKKVMIQTTSLCNGSCLICPYDKLKNINSMGVMTDSLFEKIINETSTYNVDAILLYLMNEPLMDSKIVQRINYAKSLNPFSKVYIVTNGNLLTKDLTISLLKSSADEVVISILGHKKTYLESMGLDFKKTVKNVLYFSKLVKKFKKGHDFLKVKLTRTPNLTTDKEVNQFQSYWKKKRVTTEVIESPISRAGNVSSLSKNINHDHIIGCTSMWEEEMIEILYTGQVVLCCMDWERKTYLGDIAKNSIFNVWNGVIYNKSRDYIYNGKKLPFKFICRKCELAKLGCDEKNV